MLRVFLPEPAKLSCSIGKFEVVHVIERLGGLNLHLHIADQQIIFALGAVIGIQA